jgi:hypothetical protein
LPEKVSQPQASLSASLQPLGQELLRHSIPHRNLNLPQSLPEPAPPEYWPQARSRPERLNRTRCRSKQGQHSPVQRSVSPHSDSQEDFVNSVAVLHWNPNWQEPPNSPLPESLRLAAQNCYPA